MYIHNSPPKNLLLSFFDEEDNSFSPPTDTYSSGLEELDEGEEEFVDLIKKSLEGPPEQLTSIFTALCVELYGYSLFKEQFSISFSMLKNMKFAPVFFLPTLEQDSRIQKGEFSTYFKSSEGIAFFFRFLGNPEEKKIRKYSKDEIKSFKLGVNSANHEIMAVSSFLLQIHYKNKIIKKAFSESFKQMNIFVHSLNQELKQAKDFLLLKNIKKLKHFVVLYNEMNKHREKSRNLKLENASEKMHLLTLGENINSLLDKQSVFSDWEKELAHVRQQQFESVCGALRKLRDQPKKTPSRDPLIRSRLEFTQTFLKHDLNFIPVTIESYLKIHRDNFPILSKPSRNLLQNSQVTLSKSLPPKKKKSKKQKSRLSDSRNLQPAAARPITNKSTEESKEKFSDSRQAQPIKKTLAKKSREDQKEKISDSRVEYPGRMSIPSKRYAPRVHDWFQMNPAQLKGKTYRDLSENEKLKQKYKHGFPTEIDDCMATYGVEKVHINEKRGNHPDRLICIPGEIKFYFLGEIVVERGIYNFCIGSDGEMYHRHFTTKSTEEIFECAQDAFYNFDYPSLEKSCQNVSKGFSSSMDKDDTHIQMSFDAITQAITFSLLDKNYCRVADFVLFKTTQKS